MQPRLLTHRAPQACSGDDSATRHRSVTALVGHVHHAVTAALRHSFPLGAQARAHGAAAEAVGTVRVQHRAACVARLADGRGDDAVAAAEARRRLARARPVRVHLAAAQTSTTDARGRFTTQNDAHKHRDRTTPLTTSPPHATLSSQRHTSHTTPPTAHRARHHGAKSAPRAAIESDVVAIVARLQPSDEAVTTQRGAGAAAVDAAHEQRLSEAVETAIARSAVACHTTTTAAHAKVIHNS